MLWLVLVSKCSWSVDPFFTLVERLSINSSNFQSSDSQGIPDLLAEWASYEVKGRASLSNPKREAKEKSMM